MLKRDFGILLLSVFTVYYALQHEGSFQFKKAWSYRLHDHEYLPHSDSQLPLPITADLNGDGTYEVIIATHDARIKVLSPRGRRGGGGGSALPSSAVGGGGFLQASVMGEAGLAPPGVAHDQGHEHGGEARGWAPVAMAAGYLDPQPVELVKAPRKQVVVVVTANLHVLCFDHNLKLMWTKFLKGSMPHYSAVHEVAVHVTPVSVMKGDRGLVVVGFSLRLGDHTAELADVDPLYEEYDYEEDARQDARLAAEHGDYEEGVGTGGGEGGGAWHAGDPHEQRQGDDGGGDGGGGGGARRRLMQAGGGGGGGLEEGELSVFDADERDVLRGVDLSRHFSYYAYAGGSGEQRWQHEGADFHKDLDALANTLTPQHNYRLTAADMAGRHYGEAACREYRAGVLASLPHRWARRSDTRMQEVHFEKRNRRAAKQGDARGRGQRVQPNEASRTAGGNNNPVASALGQIAAKAGSGGRPGPGGDPGTQDGAANTLVSHLQEGIEALHLFTGRTLCKLHLPATGLHVDLNGDGVVDHLQAFGGHAPRHALLPGAHQRHSSCWAVATSGIPPREPLFNGSICMPRNAALAGLAAAARGDPGADAGDMDDESDGYIEVAPPAMLPTYRSRSGGLGGIAVFLNSRGHATAFSPHGDRLWQVRTGAAWGSHHASGLDVLDVASAGGGGVATLEPVPLRQGALPSVVLAAGAAKALLLSEHGTVLDSFELPVPPALPLLVADFNSDGLNDIILVSAGGFYGFAQVRHPGGSPFGALVGCLVVVMAVVYVTQHSGGRRGRKKGRSTDRTD